MSRLEECEHRINELITNFDYYLDVFVQNIPFNNRQYEWHVRTIQMRRKLGSASVAVSSPEFIQFLWRTLQEWGIGKRGSQIVPPNDFFASFQEWKDEIEKLDQLRIDLEDLDVEKVKNDIWTVIEGLKIVDNKAVLVAHTKALHHLLPELIVPMDRKYTQAFLMRYNPEFQYNQRKVFEEAFRTFVKIARTTLPIQYVGSGWHTSQTKVIDNAIIGYCISKDIAGEKIK